MEKIIKQFQNPPAALSSRPEVLQAGLGEHHGQRTETFKHIDLWQLHLYFWTGYFEVGDSRFSIQPGAVSLLPPGVTASWIFTEEHCNHYFIHFKLPGKRQHASIQPTTQIGSKYELFSQLFSTIVSTYEKNPSMAGVTLWSLLYQLTNIHEHTELKALPGAVETAHSIMDSELSIGINATQVAERVGYSRSQLNRLFVKHMGQTLAEYLSSKRVALAEELLVYSNLTLAQIGRRIGIPNPNHLNKFIRRHLGMSPSKYRTQKSLHR